MAPLSQKQPTPRKGTETFCIFVIGIADSRNNPHPARGRKHNYSPFFICYRGNNPHPARGRKLQGLAICEKLCHRNNPHPARGRKPLIARGGGSALTETTHTPQGDGNLDGIEPVADLGRNNPHPARGRKTICVHIAEIVGETIHIPDRGQLTKRSVRHVESRKRARLLRLPAARYR